MATPESYGGQPSGETPDRASPGAVHTRGDTREPLTFDTVSAAISDILDRMDADDEAYRELRDRVEKLEADMGEVVRGTTLTTDPTPEPVAEPEGEGPNWPRMVWVLTEDIQKAMAGEIGEMLVSAKEDGDEDEAMVPLSDATALLAEKDAEIERLKRDRDSWESAASSLHRTCQNLRARITELESRAVTAEVVRDSWEGILAGRMTIESAQRIADRINAALRSNPEEATDGK